MSNRELSERENESKKLRAMGSDERNEKSKNAPSGTPSLPLVHSVPCAVMSTMVLAVSAAVGGSSPSSQGAAWGAAGTRRRLQRDCDAKDGSDDDVEGAVVEIDDAAGLEDVAAAAAALGTTFEHLGAAAAAVDGADATRALSRAAKADIASKEKREILEGVISSSVIL